MRSKPVLSTSTNCSSAHPLPFTRCSTTTPNHKTALACPLQTSCCVPSITTRPSNQRTGRVPPVQGTHSPVSPHDLSSTCCIGRANTPDGTGPSIALYDAESTVSDGYQGRGKGWRVRGVDTESARSHAKQRFSRRYFASHLNHPLNTATLLISPTLPLATNVCFEKPFGKRCDVVVIQGKDLERRRKCWRRRGGGKPQAGNSEKKRETRDGVFQSTLDHQMLTFDHK